MSGSSSSASSSARAALSSFRTSRFSALIFRFSWRARSRLRLENVGLAFNERNSSTAVWTVLTLRADFSRAIDQYRRAWPAIGAPFALVRSKWGTGLARNGGNASRKTWRVGRLGFFSAGFCPTRVRSAPHPLDFRQDCSFGPSCNRNRQEIESWLSSSAKKSNTNRMRRLVFSSR